MYLLPLAYGYFIALFGLYCNLHNVNLDWTNEVSVIKNSKATLVVMLVGFLITILPAILAVLFGGLVLFIMLCAHGHPEHPYLQVPDDKGSKAVRKLINQTSTAITEHGGIHDFPRRVLLFYLIFLQNRIMIELPESISTFAFPKIPL